MLVFKTKYENLKRINQELQEEVNRYRDLYHKTEQERCDALNKAQEYEAAYNIRLEDSNEMLEEIKALKQDVLKWRNKYYKILGEFRAIKKKYVKFKETTDSFLKRLHKSLTIKKLV